MTDFVSITVAIVIIFMVFRWLSGDASQPSRQGNTRRPARHVSPEMVETVKSMFPHIPTAAIHYDLQKTGSVELTCENVLRDGTLPMPPSPRPTTPPSASGSTIGRNGGVGSSTGAAGSSSSATASGSSSSSQNASLVHRYGLTEQASRNYVPDEPNKVWADTAEKRQEIFKNRKEFMILQARKRMMEEQERKKKKQQQEQEEEEGKETKVNGAEASQEAASVIAAATNPISA
ncbi:hypothetical protein DFQ27_007495 [Actinomortierella ambigua]|uniref:Coupling of ubiquitin conjugation to ER degradation protein 1 n=1 Tax=Actinomortierella ambigua TaxID=1343610 RepID=A0A9P6PSU2_9FUNG|nr:hypothetical protein DFQ26_005485 [Actinomortierella ambigua]KAG0253305.1 hypothetical protein DFQ27_007495 [Actinomortierella ambigua]